MAQLGDVREAVCKHFRPSRSSWRLSPSTGNKRIDKKLQALRVRSTLSCTKVKRLYVLVINTLLRSIRRAWCPWRKWKCLSNPEQWCRLSNYVYCQVLCGLKHWLAAQIIKLTLRWTQTADKMECRMCTWYSNLFFFKMHDEACLCIESPRRWPKVSQDWKQKRIKHEHEIQRETLHREGRNENAKSRT